MSGAQRPVRRESARVSNILRVQIVFNLPLTRSHGRYASLALSGFDT
jgi:hypothetical protein